MPHDDQIARMKDLGVWASFLIGHVHSWGVWTWKEPAFFLNAAERICVESAIRAVTSKAAWQLFSEHEIGSLEAGRLADVASLDTDPARCPWTPSSSSGWSQTWMDGERAHAA